MSIDKKKVKKLIGIAIAAMGATFTGMSVLAKNVFETEMRKFDCKESTKMVA